MIEIEKEDFVRLAVCFRLLNSEIGNDPIKYQNGIRMGVTSIK